MLESANEESNFVRFLRWTEKYTKVDMVYLAHGGLWLIGAQVVTSLSSIALAFAFAHLLTQESFGTYEYLLTLFGIVTVTTLRGMDSIVVQALSRGNEGTLWEGLYAKMRWGLLGSLASLGISGYYFLQGNTIIALGLLFAAIFTPLMDAVGIFGSVLSAKKDFALDSKLSAFNQTAAVLLLIATMFVTQNPLIVFAVYCGAWTMMRYLSLRITLNKYALNDKREPHALSYARHSSLASAMGTLIAAVDGIVVYHYLGASALAVYTFSMAPVLQARSFVNILGTLAIPKYASQTSAEIKRTLPQRTLLLLGIGLVLTLGYIVLAYPFFYIFFPRYLDAVLYSQVYSFTIAINLGGMALGAAIDARTTLMPKKYIYIFNAPTIILALSSVLLVQWFGIWGAITAQFLSNVVGLSVLLFTWFKIKDKDFPQHANQKSV